MLFVSKELQSNMLERVTLAYREKENGGYDSLLLKHLLDTEYICGITTPLDRHEEWHLWYVLEGKALITLRDQCQQMSITLKPGEFVLIAPHEEHILTTTLGDSCRLFDAKYMINSDLVRTLNLRSFWSKDRWGIHLQIKKIFCEVTEEKPLWIPMVRVYFQELLVLLGRACTLTHPVFTIDSKGHPSDPYISAIIQQACEFIIQNYHKDIHLSNIAEAVHLSPSYLSYIFKKYTGITINKFLSGVRITKAKELIENSDEPVESIGKKIGYPDAAYFSRCFKRHTGVSPTEYRTLRRFGGIRVNP